ncbi:MAG: hypothetical protein ABSB82_07410 [Terriglobia bacterium]|jgi:tetratricopeptide (TPR) repeat protein
MRVHFRVLTLISFLCLSPLSLFAQRGTNISGDPGQPGSANYDITAALQKHWIVAGKVVTVTGDPIKGAKVEVAPMAASGEFHSLVTNFPGEFQTEYWLNSQYVKQLSVAITVTKKGYQKARVLADLGDAEKPRAFLITLRDLTEDPNLLSQADLIAALAPKLRELSSADGLSSKSTQDYERGVEEFLNKKHSDRAVPFFTKVISRDPSCAACRTMMGLAELDYGDWDGAQVNFDEAVKAIQADRKLGRPEPFVAYGVMHSWRHDPEKAAPFFMEALKYPPQEPLAYQELGRSELLLQNWANAAPYLNKALEIGAKPEARLMLVEALLNAGSAEEANKEMTRYLGGKDVKQMPLRVRQLWAQVQEKKKVEVAYAEVGSGRKVAAIDYLRHPPPELKGIEPAQDQKELDSILKAAGKNVAAFFQNFPNTSALEQIHQEKLRHKSNKVTGSQNQEFHYICIVSTESFGPGFSEYRADLSGEKGQPHGLQEGFMLTNGFASASLVFHPAYQSQSTFRYLGRQKIEGRDAFVLAFAQQPGRARMNGNFKSGQVSMPTFSQGLAWIDASSYQILRLRTDLLTPLPEVRLERETTEIDYNEVHFKTIDQAFWLPRAVTVTVGWNGKNLRNAHQYSDFKLFNVASSQRIGKPKEEASKDATGPGAPL